LGRLFHALVVKASIEDNIFVGSALVDLYGECGSIGNADLVFIEMLIGGYAHQGDVDMALRLFE